MPGFVIILVTAAGWLSWMGGVRPSEFYGRLKSAIQARGGFSRTQQRAARLALAKGRFTTDDPAIRALMFEYARYYELWGLRPLRADLFLAIGFGCGFTFLYQWPGTVPVAAVIQIFLALLTASAVYHDVKRWRNARTLLAPWWIGS